MKFGQLIFRRIVKIVATKCQILRLKCIKIDFGWGSDPRPRCGSLQRSSPEPLAGFKGPYTLREGDIGREGKGRGKGRQGGGEVRQGRDEGRGPRVYL